MNRDRLLAELFHRGVKVWADGDQLRVRAPRGALTAELRDSLAAHKREILRLASSSAGATPAPRAPLVPSARDGPSPLSFGQERLWCLSQLRPDSPVYNLPKALRLRGPLDVPALERGVREIVRRHEVLRTTFPAVGGQPAPLVSSDLPVSLPRADLRALPGAERNAEVQRLSAEESRRPFDLARGPLVRVALWRLGEEEHLFLLTTHHIVFDGWSFNVFCREVGALYDAFCARQPSPLPALPVQYADFARWERESLEHEAPHLAYWTGQLSGSGPGLAWPLARTRPPGAVSQGARRSLILPQDLADALRGLSQRRGCSLFMTLLAAFQTLLYSHTGQEDIIVCSPVAGRERSETRELIGYFTRLLPMRTDLAGEPSFEELLTRVRQVVSDAYAHQDVALQRLSALPEARGTSLSRGMFHLQAPTRLPALPGVTASLEDAWNGSADFDLSLSLEEGTTLAGALEYKTALFEAATILQMSRDFQKLLEAIVADPGLRISRLREVVQGPLRVSAERRRPEARSEDRGTPGSVAAPRDELELQLTGCWEEAFGRKPIGVDEDFFDLGGHSLLAVRLFLHLEQRLGRRLPLATLLQAPTIRQLADLLRQEGWAPSRSSLVPIQRGGGKRPFFCVHGAGGHVLNYHALARRLGEDRPFYGLQAQGLEGGRPLHRTVEEMAAHYLEEVRGVQPEGPYLLGGYCLGGTVALEMARRLLGDGQRVGLLALFDTYNWSRLSGVPGSLPYQAYFLVRNLLLLEGREKLVFLGQRARWAGRRAATKLLTWRSGGLLASIRKLHDRAAASYEPRAYPGRITLFCARHWAPYGDPRTGWEGLAAGGLDVHELSAFPEALLVEPFVRDLAEELRASLSASEA